jgi:DNA helicase-2/ATP-dependent DNA helicase PcrA
VRFFERREVKDSLSYLRLIAGDDDIAFKRIANVPSRKIGKSTMEKISAIAKIQGCSMYEALKTLTLTKGYNKDSILQFIEAIETVRDCVGKMSISDLLDYIVRKSGLLEMYRNDEEEERLENISELINSIKTYEADHKEDDITLDHYLQDIALYTNADYAKDKDQVKMMTIHQAKGLEFPYVFIAGLSEGIMPNKRSVRERKHKAMEEERRLMYVAVTRAEQKLFLTESEGFSMQGGFEKYPSRFIREIKQGLFVTEGRMDQSIWSQAITFSKNFDRECELGQVEGNDEHLFFEGDRVHHSHFGDGTVIKAYDNGEFCEVDFESCGVRAIKSDKLSQA